MGNNQEQGYVFFYRSHLRVAHRKKTNCISVYMHLLVFTSNSDRWVKLPTTPAKRTSTDKHIVSRDWMLHCRINIKCKHFRVKSVCCMIVSLSLLCREDLISCSSMLMYNFKLYSLTLLLSISSSLVVQRKRLSKRCRNKASWQLEKKKKKKAAAFRPHCNRSWFSKLRELKLFIFVQVIEINLSSMLPHVSGPKRPQDRVAVSSMKKDFQSCLDEKVTLNKYSASLKWDVRSCRCIGSIFLLLVAECSCKK